jgi:hypothetical protein
VFGLYWKDIHLVLPEDAAANDLPPGVGAILLSLFHQTKTEHFKRADLLLTYPTCSDFALGDWVRSLQQELGGPNDDEFVFRSDNGTPWSSHYYRHKYLYPFLTLMYIQGDLALTHYNGAAGNSLADALRYFHYYWQGGRTHCSRHCITNKRSPTTPEVTEHACWRLAHSSMDMPTLYLEWSLYDQPIILLLCF